MPVDLEDRLLTRKQAAEILGFQPQTLARWKWEGREDCPPEIRVGSRAVRYRLSDLQHWIARRLPGEGSGHGGLAAQTSAAVSSAPEPAETTGGQGASRSARRRKATAGAAGRQAALGSDLLAQEARDAMTQPVVEEPHSLVPRRTQA